MNEIKEDLKTLAVEYALNSNEAIDLFALVLHDKMGTKQALNEVLYMKLYNYTLMNLIEMNYSPQEALEIIQYREKKDMERLKHDVGEYYMPDEMPETGSRCK